jgi:hypothetical protein
MSLLEIDMSSWFTSDLKMSIPCFSIYITNVHVFTVLFIDDINIKLLLLSISGLNIFISDINL